MEVLNDLPDALWPVLLRTVRRVADDLPRTHLPTPLRPFAGWHPDRLADPRARHAVAQALQDPSLRGEILDRLDAATEADADVQRLRAAHGPQEAAAVLAAAGRWDALAALAAADRAPEGSPAAATGEPHEMAPGGSPPGAAAPQPAAVSDGTATAVSAERLAVEQRRVAQAERRAEAEAQRVRALRAELDERAAQITRLEDERRQLLAQVQEERTAHRKRVTRLRARVRDAEAARAAQEDPRAELIAELEGLLARLRSASPSEASEQDGFASADASPVASDPEGGQPHASSARPPAQGSVAVARPGRPCTLPAGRSRAHPDGVRALLGAEGITVIVDGYNVTMHPSGQPVASLEGQRRWLRQLAAATASRYEAHHVLVFDGADEPASTDPSPRLVLVVFSAHGQTADDRIVEIVAASPTDEPILVVTADRELTTRLAEHHVDVVTTAVYLEAVAG